VATEDEEGVAEVPRGPDVRLRRDVRPRTHRQHGLRIEGAGELVVRAVAQDVGDDRRAHEPDQDDEEDVEAAGDRELVAPEPEAYGFPVATGANRLRAELAVRLRRDGRRKACAGGNELWTFGRRHEFGRA